MKIILFLGYHGSGKTTHIYELTKALTADGFRVGTLKHIHAENLSLDKKGKDTEVHAKAGASTVVAVSPKEMMIMRRGASFTIISMHALLRIFRQDRIDFLMVEGFYKRLSSRKGVIRVLCARSEDEVILLLGQHKKPICCILGRFSRDWKTGTYEGIPVIQFPKGIKQLRKLIGA